MCSYTKAEMTTHSELAEAGNTHSTVDSHIDSDIWIDHHTDEPHLGDVEARVAITSRNMSSIGDRPVLKLRNQVTTEILRFILSSFI